MRRLIAFVSRTAAWLRLAEHRREAAGHPAEISARGWRELAWTTLRCTLKHRAPSQAAAATFYAFLATAPAIGFVGSVYGLFGDPGRLERGLADFAEFVPAGVLKLIQGEASRFAGGDDEKLVAAALGFAAVALLSATSSVRALMAGLNNAYGVEDSRRWWIRRLLAAAFAAGVALMASTVFGLVLKSADLLGGSPGPVTLLRLALRWLSLFVAMMAALAVLYRYGPHRRRARWRWVTPGSALAAATGLATSACMSLYLTHFVDYERTYGGLGTILGLLVWLWSVNIVVLAGAELNRAMEAKTVVDTSVSGRETAQRDAAAPARTATG